MEIKPINPVKCRWGSCLADATSQAVSNTGVVLFEGCANHADEFRANREGAVEEDAAER